MRPFVARPSAGRASLAAVTALPPSADSRSDPGPRQGARQPVGCLVPVCAGQFPATRPARSSGALDVSRKASATSPSARRSSCQVDRRTLRPATDRGWRRKATSRSPFWDRSRAPVERAGLVAGNCACAYRNQAPDRLTGTLPWTRVACGNSAAWGERGDGSQRCGDSRRRATKRFSSRDPDSFRRALCRVFDLLRQK